jgi:predicted nucleic acid-binding protein
MNAGDRATMRQIIRFLCSVVLLELRLGADTPRRQRAVDRVLAAFPTRRLIAPLPPLFDQAGRLFRALHGDGSGFDDRLGLVNDLLLALTARQIGATLVTSNLDDFRQIARHLPGLRIRGAGLNGVQKRDGYLISEI